MSKTKIRLEEPGRKLTFSLSCTPDHRAFCQSVQDRLGKMLTWDERRARHLDQRLSAGIYSYEDVHAILEGGPE